MVTRRGVEARVLSAVDLLALRARRLQGPRLPSPEDADVVVSFTTYPARLRSAALVARSLLTQRASSYAVVLYLSSHEFDGVPAALAPLTDHGLDVRLIERNDRSYKKLLPALADFSDKVLVTADDDIVYPREWLSGLLRGQAEHPDCVVGYRGTQITFSDSKVDPYVRWPPASRDPSFDTFLTGAGGILYPVGSLPRLTGDIDEALRLCPTADDIWFKAMSLVAGRRSVRVGHRDRDFSTVAFAQKSALRKTNVSEGRNDVQLQAVMNEYELWRQIQA